jgi:hypothetical protein
MSNPRPVAPAAAPAASRRRSRARSPAATAGRQPRSRPASLASSSMPSCAAGCSAGPSGRRYAPRCSPGLRCVAIHRQRRCSGWPASSARRSRRDVLDTRTVKRLASPTPAGAPSARQASSETERAWMRVIDAHTVAMAVVWRWPSPARRAAQRLRLPRDVHGRTRSRGRAREAGRATPIRSPIMRLGSGAGHSPGAGR